MDQRRTEFETGYGLEGILPDLLCYQIGMQELVPEFREGRYGLGLIKAVIRITTILENPEEAQQFTGQPTVLSYSRVLFQAAGWQGHASVVTVAIMWFASMIPVALADRIGRKALLIMCGTIMVLAPSALAFGYWGEDEEIDDSLTPLQKQFILYGMFAYIGGYQTGYGPLTWTLISELLPTEIRGAAMAVSVETYFVAKFITQLAFPIILEEVGWGSTFILFTFISICSLIFVIRVCPARASVCYTPSHLYHWHVWCVSITNTKVAHYLFRQA